MAKKSRTATIDWKGLLVLVGIYVLVAFLWRTPWVLPLKIFVVLLHEMSHGIAAVLTGGRIVEMEVNWNEGGVCKTAGGIEFLVVSAGYLGSLFFGVTLLLVGTRTRASTWVAGLLGALIAVMAIRYMPLWSFGKVFAVAAGGLLAALAFLPPVCAELALRVIGVTSCLYVFLDIKSDVLDQDHALSDASALARRTGVPGVFWGLLWIGISVVVTFVAAKWAVTGSRPKEPAATSGKK
jgi:preprotein translocase subunit SecG